MPWSVLLPRASSMTSEPRQVPTAQTDLEGWVGGARIPQDGSAAREHQAPGVPTC